MHNRLGKTMKIIRNSNGSYTAVALVCGEIYRVTMPTRSEAIDAIIGMCTANAVGL